MKVKILEKKLSSMDGDRHILAEEGDVITVTAETGARWCGYGWCEDVDGKVKTGERKAGVRSVLNVQNARVAGRARKGG